MFNNCLNATTFHLMSKKTTRCKDRSFEAEKGKIEDKKTKKSCLTDRQDFAFFDAYDI